MTCARTRQPASYDTIPSQKVRASYNSESQASILENAEDENLMISSSSPTFDTKLALGPTVVRKQLPRQA